MKHIKLKLILHILLGIIILGYILFLKYSIQVLRADNTAGINADNLITKLDSIYTSNNKIPKNIKEDLIKKGIELQIHSGIFKINIEIFNDSTSYEIRYYQPPLGPYRKYNSKNREWSYEE
jgi:hypothetical protein